MKSYEITLELYINEIPQHTWLTQIIGDTAEPGQPKTS